MTDPLLRFEQLQKTVPRGRRVLDIDTLSIYPGKCLLLTGPNGAGKTTLLKILSGLETPDDRIKTVVHYDNWCLSWKTARGRYCRDVIYLHQQSYLFDNTVFENIRYGLRRRGLGREEINRRVHRALEWAALSHLAQRNTRELSGGEKQRVALTRALVLQPRVLLLDEPFSGLDENARSRTGFLIQRIKSENVAVVVTSHELQSVAGIADSHLELYDGQLVSPSRKTHDVGTSIDPRTNARVSKLFALREDQG
jgi:tungstate transport system ATP-binding protein